MVEVAIYLTHDYSINESIWVDLSLTKDQITQIIDSKFETWYYYDIL